MAEENQDPNGDNTEEPIEEAVEQPEVLEHFDRAEEEGDQEDAWERSSGLFLCSLPLTCGGIVAWHRSIVTFKEMSNRRSRKLR